MRTNVYINIQINRNTLKTSFLIRDELDVVPSLIIKVLRRETYVKTEKKSFILPVLYFLVLRFKTVIIDEALES